MNEIEWLDKVKKNFEYKEESITMTELFREMYASYNWDDLIRQAREVQINIAEHT